MTQIDPDLEIAGAFLSRLDPSEKHTFQLIHDQKKNQKAKILHGSIWEHADELIAAQREGYGVFVCINRTNFKGRTADDIVAIRAVAADLDGAPKENIYRFGLVPSVTIESSPGKFHAWWLVNDEEISLVQYTPIMERLASIIESDHKICDLPRVLRVPGFYHQKGEPFQSRIIDETPRTYTYLEIEEELALFESTKVKKVKPLGTSALDDACKKIVNAKEGERNDTMFNQAYRVARQVKKGLLDEDKALEALQEAASVHAQGRETITEQFRRIIKELPDEVQLREVILQDGQEANTALELTDILVSTGRVFQRGRRLVWPITESRKWGSTTSLLEPLGHQTIVHLLKDIVVFAKHDGRGKKTKVSKLSHELSDQVIKLGVWPNVPKCEGILNTPTLRPNGSLLNTPGFDSLTGYYLELDRALQLPQIPDAPTKAQAVAAKNLIFTLLDEVAFVSELDKAVALSAALTTVTRAAYEKAPMFLVSANASSTGKSYLVYILTTLACGTAAPVIGFSTSKEEIEKRLDGLILDAVPCFSLDNVESIINGPPKLCQMLSEETVGVRRLGESGTILCSTRSTVFATGNGVNFGSDMIRRGLTIRLNAKVERPESREFKHDPGKEAARNRGQYVAALLTIVRAYLVSGEKERIPQTASYNEWSRFCREPVTWLGLPDPVECQREARAQDDFENERRGVVNYLARRYPSGYRIKTSDFLRDVRDDALSNVDGADDVLDYLNSNCMSRSGREISRSSVGWLLCSLENKIVNGKALVRLRTSTSHGTTWAIKGAEEMDN